MLACRNDIKEVKAATLGTIEVWCDESLMNIISQQEEVFESSYKYADLKIKYASENEVMRKFYADSVDVIIVSHPLDSTEVKNFNDRKYFPRQFKFGKSAIAFVGNIKRKTTSYNYDEMLKLLGSNDNKQIFAVENTGSGIANELIKHTKTDQLGKNVYALKSKDAIVDWLEKNPDGIGIIDWSEISDTDDAKARNLLAKIKLIGIKKEGGKEEYALPYQYNLNGFYPFTRDLLVIRRYGLTDVSLGFASFICSDRGQKIMLKAGLLPEYQSERWIEFKGLKDVEVIK